MQRTVRTFSVDDIAVFNNQLLQWSQQFETIIWLDSNDYNQKHTSFNCALAVEEFTCIQTDYYNGFEKLEEYQSNVNDYIFGYISYDVKNDVELLSSNNFDGLQFPDLYFFQPQKLIFIKDEVIEFHYLKMVDNEIAKDFETICTIDLSCKTRIKERSSNLEIKSRISKESYIKKVTEVLVNIKRGNIYEANFCQEFYAENSTIRPFEVYQHLNEISKPPFAAFLKTADKYALCASPERYLKKEHQTIISQPIKGTAKRLKHVQEDKKIAQELSQNTKEIAENVMIVDLVRNDLSKSAIKGSVVVEELCKVYPFKQVHQMISSVISKIPENMATTSILKDTFPMGSMTGAPKIKAMEIIERLEETKRGLYSGAIGYFTPENDFDFNVVIRSILYNENKQYISYSVGSAITAKAIPEKEYEECLVKAEALKYVLLNTC